MRLQGEIEIKNVEKARTFIQSYKNLLNCIPGIKDINGNRFIVENRIGFLKLEAEGEVLSFDFHEDGNKAVIRVKGVGVNSTITSVVRIVGDKLIYDVEYIAEITIPGISKIVDKIANEITEKIIECTKNYVS